MNQKKEDIIYGNWYDLGTFEIAYFNNGIYHARLKRDEVFTLQCIRKSMEFREKFQIFNAYMLVEFGEFSTADLDARIFSMTRDDEPFMAEAYVTNNLAQRIIVDNYVKHNKRNIPFARFDSVQEAYNWIEGLKNQSNLRTTV